MSSNAVLTQDIFDEHCSGLWTEQDHSPEEENLPTYEDAFPPLPEKVASPTGTQEPAGAWNSKIRPLRSSAITQVFHVSLKERKYKDIEQHGKRDQARVCVDIMHKTGAHLQLSIAKDRGLSIMVSGGLDAVMKARKMIVSQLLTLTSATVAIPKEHHRFVIGKNGEKVQELELKTATRIQIPQADNPSNHITISGTKAGLEKAKHEVLLISAEQDERAVERVNIDRVYHPFLTGAYNKLVGEMMQETGACINVPPPSVDKTEIVITGGKEEVACAVAMIKKIHEEKKNSTTIAVEVKKSQHKYVIGPKGNTLQEILEKTGVSVEIPPSDSSSETVVLRGEKDRLGLAVAEVYIKANSYTVSSVSAPSWLHRFIIGKRGQKMAKIAQLRPKVLIEFTEGEDEITLEGPTNDVQMVRTLIEAIVTDLKSRMDYAEISVDPKFHRQLIGKGGVNINRIKELHKVTVHFPPDNEKSNLICIEGDPHGVQEAKKELLELASHMENELAKELILEQRFHRAIIGQKGENIKEVQNKFPEVVIRFPDLGQKSDIVHLRGPRIEVEICAKFMQKIVENIFSVSVPIFKQFHKNVIGKGGANIKNICEETNTKIDLPAENSNSEMIVITGKKPDCEAARIRILAIQKGLANITEMEVSIPSKLHNSLIGSKGHSVRSIMEACGGVHIHFPTEGSGIDQVTIQGPVEDVEKAKQLLLALAEEMQIKSHTAELHAKPEYHKFLIGRGGGNIRKVHDRTGARIIFPTAEDQDKELITVVGTEEAVRKAQKELEELIKGLDNVVEDHMILHPKHHRYFMARRGQVLRDLADEYGGVMVSFPRTGSQSDKVTLKGAKDCVEAAKKRMLEIIEDLDAQVTIECTIAQRFHRSIMGPKGSRIQQITRDHNVQIKFPDREDLSAAPAADVAIEEKGEPNGEGDIPKKCDVIVLSGRRERCESAVEALKALVPATVEVEVPSELHRYIIGQKGSGIRKITDTFKVNIHLPAPELRSEIIVIIGPPVHLDRAKEALLERVKDLQAEQEGRALRSFKLTITVDPKYHAKIIGRKGATITNIRTEHDVDIQFPKRNSKNQDQITITGHKTSTKAARDAIQGIVDELEEMISEDITLDSRVHARIIGARGRSIRKITNDFKVDLRFPQPGAADPNLVTVTGRSDLLEDAIDHLLNLEKEYMSDVVYMPKN